MRNSMRRSAGTTVLLSAMRRLDFGRASQRIDDAGELDQQAVAGGLDDAAAVFGDFRIDQLGAQRLEPCERPFFVRTHQPRIAGHIGGEDRGEPTFDASWPGGLHRTSSVAYDPTRTSAWRALSMRAGLSACHIVVQIEAHHAC